MGFRPRSVLLAWLQPLARVIEARKSIKAVHRACREKVCMFRLSRPIAAIRMADGLPVFRPGQGSEIIITGLTSQYRYNLTPVLSFRQVRNSHEGHRRAQRRGIGTLSAG